MRVAMGRLDKITYKTTSTLYKVRPSDLDSLGHVNNAIALEYFELGRFDWTKQNSFELPENLIAVVTQLNVVYLKEIFVNDIKIVTTLAKTSYYELIFEQQVLTINSPSNSPSASEENQECRERERVTATIHVALIDKNTKRPARLNRLFAKKEDEPTQS